MVKRRGKKRERIEPLSLNPLSPEEALRGFMETDPERVRKRERGEPVDYLCEVCGETFGAQVIHCPECDHHYPLADGEYAGTVTVNGPAMRKPLCRWRSRPR